MREASLSGRAAPFLGFAGFGVFWGVWGACLPLLRAHAGVGDARFGVALLLVGAGALPAMLLTGRLVDAVGLRVAGMLLALLGIAGVVLCAVSSGYAGLCAGILAVGAASGATDVAINALAATAEKRTGRPVVARSHAAFSATVAASSLAAGALAAATGSLLAAFTAAAVVVVALGTVVAAATRSITVRDGAAPDGDQAAAAQEAAGHRDEQADRAPGAAGHPEEQADGAAAGREGGGRLPGRGMLLVVGGVGALAFAAENAFQTWAAVLLTDAFAASPALAAVAPAAFATTAALARLAGGPVMLRRPITTLITASLIATAGGGLTAFAPSLPLTLAGVVAAALGTATLFPTLLSYGLRPVPDAFRGRATSAISTVAYLGFLAGPAYFGLLADAAGVQRAFLGVAALTGLLLAAVPMLPRLRRPEPITPRRTRPGARPSASSGP